MSNIILRSYQAPLVESVLKSLATKPTVLAACPNAGKTMMSLNIIERLQATKPKLKVLVLAHGTSVLRTQFGVEAEKVFPGQVATFSGSEDVTKASIVVTIPQSAKKINFKKNKFDLLIVDEAHQYYFAKEYGVELRKKIGAKMQLLLTGTPFSFTKANNEEIAAKQPAVFNMEMITINEILDKDPEQFANVVIEVCQSKYDFRNEHFNADDNLLEGVRFPKAATEHTVKKVLKMIIPDRLMGNNVQNYSHLRKTIFACNNIEQANHVKDYLTKNGVVTCLSTSDDDTNSEEIQRFKEAAGGEQALVVVYRGILGFSDEDLVNVVDLSCTRNPGRIYQLLCRAVRKYKNSNEQHPKKFIKIGPRDAGGHEYTIHLMAAVLHLNERDWYSKFDGSNFNQLPLPAVRTPRRPRAPNGRVGAPARPKPKFYLDITASDKMFEGTRITDAIKDDVYVAGSTTLSKVKQVLYGMTVMNIDGNKAKLLEMAKNGEPRPRTGSKLHPSLNNYLNKGHLCYDQSFYVNLKEVAPHWFPEIKKQDTEVYWSKIKFIYNKNNFKRKVDKLIFKLYLRKNSLREIEKIIKNTKGIKPLAFKSIARLIKRYEDKY